MSDTPPDRLASNPKSPFYDEAVLNRGVGIKFKGEEKTNVDEYCVSEGWVRRIRTIAGRLAAGALALTAGAAVHAPVVWDSDLAPPPDITVAPRTQRHILDEGLQTLGGAFGGAVGIAVYNVDEGWAADFNGAQVQPQQSVSKLWVALAVLDAVDRGVLSLSTPVTIRKDDLSIFHHHRRRPAEGRDRAKRQRRQ
jgi:hypothetical protein